VQNAHIDKVSLVKPRFRRRKDHQTHPQSFFGYNQNPNIATQIATTSQSTKQKQRRPAEAGQSDGFVWCSGGV